MICWDASVHPRVCRVNTPSRCGGNEAQGMKVLLIKETGIMKTSSYHKHVALGLVLLLPSLAGAQDEQRVRIEMERTVNGKTERVVKEFTAPNAAALQDSLLAITGTDGKESRPFLGVGLEGRSGPGKGKRGTGGTCHAGFSGGQGRPSAGRPDHGDRRQEHHWTARRNGSRAGAQARRPIAVALATGRQKPGCGSDLGGTRCGAVAQARLGHAHGHGHGTDLRRGMARPAGRTGLPGGKAG
jgi:hypothetical protein